MLGAWLQSLRCLVMVTLGLVTALRGPGGVAEPEELPSLGPDLLLSLVPGSLPRGPSEGALLCQRRGASGEWASLLVESRERLAPAGGREPCWALSRPLRAEQGGAAAQAERGDTLPCLASIILTGEMLLGNVLRAFPWWWDLSPVT